MWGANLDSQEKTELALESVTDVIGAPPELSGSITSRSGKRGKGGGPSGSTFSDRKLLE